MASGGIGEAALISAAVGGGMSALQGRDPLQGMIMGGLLGGAGAGLGLGAGAAGGEALAGEAVAADALASDLANSSLGSSMNAASSFNPYADFGAGTGVSSGMPFQTGGQNVLQNQLGASMSAPMANPDILANGIGGAGTSLVSSPIAGATTTAAGGGGGGISGLLDTAGSYLPETTAGKVALGGGLGLAALMAQERNKYGVPEAEKYTGPLSKFSYNPNTYKPDLVAPPVNPYQARYASGGPVEMMSNQAAMGANTMYPMANMATSSFATPYQTPQSTNMLANMAPSGGGAVNIMSGEPSMQGTRMASGGSIRHYDLGGEIGGAFNSIGNQVGNALSGVNNLITNAGQGRVSLADQPGTMSMDDPRFKARMEAMLQGKPVPQYASGGISSLGSYSDGGRMLKGPGDGMSDSIPARIGRKQEARLADGEFVVPADVVSHLGNGSTDAGAKQLYSMMDKVRTARTGRKSQGRQIKPHRYMPA